MKKQPTIHWLGEDGRNVFVECQGQLLAVAFRVGPSHAPMPKRGQVGAFSKASRLRMFKRFNRVDWTKAGRCTFGTTTWRDEIGRPSKEKLSLFRGWLHRSVEEMAGKHIASVWRTEWVLRKSGRYMGEPMPHMHWIYLDIPWLDKHEYNRRAAQAMGVDRVRCELEECRSLKETWFYINKKLGYVAKSSCTLVIDAYLNKNPHGRPWGMTRRELVPYCPQTLIRMMPGDIVEEIRAIAIECWNKVPIEEDAGFTVFGPAAERVQKFLADKGLTYDGERI
jgi:hypothetical protein